MDVNIHIENNANLCAFAERVFNHHDSDHLLCVTMYSGIGLGIIMDGDLIKGVNGYAGEMGHMIIFPDGNPCKCGNKGCWELYASETSLFTSLNKKGHPGITYDQLERFIYEHDSVVCEEMDHFINHLSIGLNNIINLYNPETIVLNSDVLQIYPEAVEAIENNLHSNVSQYHRLEISTLGKKATVMGACALAAKRFLGVPEITLELASERDILNTH